VLRAAWTVGAAGTLAAQTLTPLVIPALLGSEPLVQVVHADDLVDAARLACHAGRDGTFNVAGAGVLPFSTVVKLIGRLRAPAPEIALRRACSLVDRRRGRRRRARVVPARTRSSPIRRAPPRCSAIARVTPSRTRSPTTSPCAVGAHGRRHDPPA
jgi:nucleoside-diphosphate-sugar epimerase